MDADETESLKPPRERQVLQKPCRLPRAYGCSLRAFCGVFLKSQSDMTRGPGMVLWMRHGVTIQDAILETARSPSVLRCRREQDYSREGDGHRSEISDYNSARLDDEDVSGKTSRVLPLQFEFGEGNPTQKADASGSEKT